MRVTKLPILADIPFNAAQQWTVKGKLLQLPRVWRMATKGVLRCVLELVTTHKRHTCCRREAQWSVLNATCPNCPKEGINASSCTLQGLHITVLQAQSSVGTATLEQSVPARLQNAALMRRLTSCEAANEALNLFLQEAESDASTSTLASGFTEVSTFQCRSGLSSTH